MSNWEKKARPNVADFDLPVTHGTPSAAPAPRKKYRRVRNAIERARDRRWHEAHYVPVLVRSEPEYDHAEIEAEIAKVRREKMLLRAVGKEARDATL